MKNILKSGGSSLVSVVAQGLARLLYSVIIARLMVPGSLAGVNTLISIAMFASLLWPASVAMAATKFVSRARGAGDRILEASVLATLKTQSVLTSLIFGLGAGCYTYLFHDPGTPLASILAFSLVVGLGLTAFSRSILFASNNATRAAMLDVTSMALALVGLLAVISVDLRPFVLVPLIAGYALFICLGWPKSKTRERVPVHRAEMTSFVAWGVTGAVATGGFLQITMVIATNVGSRTSSDLYAAALSLATPATMLTSALSLVVFPSISRAAGSGNHGSVKRQTDWAMRGLALVLVGCFGALTLVAPTLLQVVYGDRFRNGSDILSILLVASLVGTLAGPASDSLSSQSRAEIRHLAEVRLAGLAVGLLTSVVLVPLLGVVGVALSYLGGMLVVGLGPVAMAWKKYAMNWGPLAVRFVAGMFALIVLLIIESRMHPGPALAIAFAILFLVIWGSISAADVQRLLRARQVIASQ